MAARLLCYQPVQCAYHTLWVQTPRLSHARQLVVDSVYNMCAFNMFQVAQLHDFYNMYPNHMSEMAQIIDLYNVWAIHMYEVV